MKESDTKPSVLISMFTLQFLGVAKRKRVLHSLEHLVRFHGATLLIAEKVYLNDPKLQMLIHRMHISEKRKILQIKIFSIKTLSYLFQCFVRQKQR